MENLNQDMKGGKKTDYEVVAQIAIISILAVLMVYNGIKIYIYGVNGAAIGSEGIATRIGTVSASEIIPTGIPEVYGGELNIKYDYISANDPELTEETIGKLSSYEDMALNSAQMARYVRIGSSISCEYCCGAQSLVFSNGQRACGCAHSYAMRGLAKYLLTEHPDVTDEQILSELGKFKVLFFPGVHEQKAAALKANGIDSKDYINLASNKYGGIENQASSSGSGGSGMVGGC